MEIKSKLFQRKNDSIEYEINLTKRNLWNNETSPKKINFRKNNSKTEISTPIKNRFLSRSVHNFSYIKNNSISCRNIICLNRNIKKMSRPLIIIINL